MPEASFPSPRVHLLTSARALPPRLLTRILEMRIDPTFLGCSEFSPGRPVSGCKVV